MKITIAGAGPAGLFLAEQLARSGSSHDITILERGRQGQTPGFGITLRSHVLELLQLNRLQQQSLEGRVFRYDGKPILDLPNPEHISLVTFSRAAMISAMTERCRALGVRLVYNCDAASLTESEIAENDLIVAADGAHSTLRARFADAFRPTITMGGNYFAWLGATIPFHKLTILLSNHEPALLGWAYKYTSNLSTLIVECTASAYRSHDFYRKSPDELRDIFSEAFESDLQTGQILAGDSLHMQRFPVISCEKLRHRNLVLIGDAAHTTHFSQGFGTMFAIDDALTLHAAIQESMHIEDAVSSYEALQQPKIREFQNTATASMRWAEHLLDATEIGDKARLKELISARWPGNAVPAGPLDSFAGIH